MEPIPLEYTKAPWYKRIFAFLLDLCAAALLATSLSAGGDAVLRQSSSYVEAEATMNRIELSSGLYVSVSGKVTAYTNYVSSLNGSDSLEEEDYQSQDEDFDAVLVSFYSNAEFFPSQDGLSQLETLKTGNEITLDGEPYFEYQTVDGVPQAVKKSAVTYQELYSFYVTAIDDYAIPLVSSHSEEYINASKLVFWSTLLLVYVISLLSLAVFFIGVPLLFRRGYQTLGKKAFRISLINASAVHLSPKQYWARSSLLFFVEFVLSSLSFGIPLIVSFSMMMLRKDGQAFHDYVSGSYVVDTSSSTIYYSQDEYLRTQQRLQNIEIHDASELR